MKKVLIISLVVFFIVGLIGFASAGKDGKTKCSHSGTSKHDCLKDANFEIKKVENGVVITVTSDKKDTVKFLQEQWAPKLKTCCSKTSCTSQCPHHKSKHHSDKEAAKTTCSGHKSL